MFLEKILTTKQAEVARLKARTTAAQLIEQAARFTDRAVSFAEALSHAGQIDFICEIKQRSPSKGLLRQPFDPIALACEYETAGASAISVVTDKEFFAGSCEYVSSIAECVALPLLRKDFIIDPIQIYESAAFGASAFLLIARILDDVQLKEYIALGNDLALDAVVEVHSAHEVERSLQAGARIIGVNNRDLDTFTVDIRTTETVCKDIPADIITVSESGIRSREDIIFVTSCGVEAVLIGEALMRTDDITATLKALMGI